MKSIARAIVAAAAALASFAAAAEYVMFTGSSVVSLPGGTQAGTPTSTDGCLVGDCYAGLKYNTSVGGLLTVTAKDIGLIDSPAYVYQSTSSAGLGVVTGAKVFGHFTPTDVNMALSGPTEKLVLTFSKPVQLNAAFFFPDDRSSHALTHELDSFDKFTLSVNGGSTVDYSFGTAGGQPVTFATPLIGTTFTFGYSSKFIGLSGEDYFLAGLNISAPVPEPTTYALIGLGLAGAGFMARRRKAA